MSTRVATLSAAPEIRQRLPFTTSGAMYGMPPSAPVLSNVGRLPREHTRTLQGQMQRGSVTYVVWSYGTPIAWHDSRDGWQVPAVTYSCTTSRHQGVVRRAIATP